MRVLIAAGGTGGHVFPAVAVAAGLLDRGDDLRWVGRPYSLEESEAKVLGIPFTSIPLMGFKRKICFQNIRAFWNFLKGRRIAKRILKDHRSEVLFALGSYVSAPVVSAALSLGIPVVLHEQNVIPGLVVSHYARKVNLLLLAKPLVGKDLKAQTRIVGIPLRPMILRERSSQWYHDLDLDADKKTLFIFGGSQGAKVLIEHGIGLAELWAESNPDWQILLQTGVANLAWAGAQTDATNLILVGHLREMGKAYACADVIVARSGAVTCAELEVVGKPAVLVPYPHATRNHQQLNAESFIKDHAGVVIPESELSVRKLNEAVLKLAATSPVPVERSKPIEPVHLIVEALDSVVKGSKG